MHYSAEDRDYSSQSATFLKVAKDICFPAQQNAFDGPALPWPKGLFQLGKNEFGWMVSENIRTDRHQFPAAII